MEPASKEYLGADLIINDREQSLLLETESTTFGVLKLTKPPVVITMRAQDTTNKIRPGPRNHSLQI